MLVSRTNIRGLHWAICSLQSRAVVRNQLKSSSGGQFPKPLKPQDNCGEPVWCSHTRPLLKGFLWSVFGKGIHFGTQHHSISYVARHKAPSSWPEEIPSYTPGSNKFLLSILSCSAHLSEGYLEMLPACGLAPVPLRWDVVYRTCLSTADGPESWCTPCHGFPNCLQSAVHS